MGPFTGKPDVEHNNDIMTLHWDPIRQAAQVNPFVTTVMTH